MSGKVIKLKEHSTLKIPLEELGYIQLARRALGNRASDLDINKRALDRFLRKNVQYLSFLDIKTDGFKLLSQGKVGVIPLIDAAADNNRNMLIIYPMSPWNILSDFIGKTRQSDWLDIKEDWEIDNVFLDLELWYFARPFISETKLVLEKPGRAFMTTIKYNQFPAGITDWSEYAISGYPYRKLIFKNKINQQTINALPHFFIKWCVNAIKDSITKPELVPEDYKSDIVWIENTLGDIKSVIPNRETLKLLPRTGAWIGYSKVYNEIEKIAALCGILNLSKNGCAFSIRAEELFEIMVQSFCKEWADINGFGFRQDKDDSSRISIIPNQNSKAYMLRSLRPDVILSSQNTVIIIDAKYKRHFDIANRTHAEKQDKQVWYEEYRHDLHQVISYGVNQNKPRKVFLLTHPSVESNKKEYNLQLWKISSSTNLIGLLPIYFGKNSTLIEIKNLYFRELSNILLVKNF
jgi:hypothetical protein